MFRISKYVLYDIIRGKVMITYTLFLLLVSFSLFNIETESSKALLSLMNIILIVVPLVSMIFSTIHYYNSYEFIELMLSQPISCTTIILNEFTGTTLSLTTAYLIGVGVPVLIYNFNATSIAL